ncbi:MAG TPA: tRNA (adenosine(37)-N6)-dimethylallyltransferase MiaA [Terriglobales bacterium]|jgi:tRNA dimethylallyltransferase|nr:tRNA (adenosine(37)-N6)-dimethylallyltransferase MiaA [Terriglobales bacterium]
MSLEPLLVVILGPTASGKTALSLRIAEQFGGEIVSCDSVAVYREFDIGTAKPSKAERQRVRHHLIDVASPIEEFTAGDYARLARKTIADIHSRECLPIVVGGTGLYLRALLEGLFEGPARSEQLRIRLRRRADQRTIEHLHRILSRLDPEAAARIHPNDTPKLIRAIEVCLLAGERLTVMWDKGRDPLTGFRILRIGLEPERNVLYERINTRCAGMFEAGLIEETRRLLTAYQSPDATHDSDPRPVARPLASLGYRQATQHLRGELTADVALLAAQQAHRNYAKRQLTWFRREPDVSWFPAFGDDPEVQQEVLKMIAREVEQTSRQSQQVTSESPMSSQARTDILEKLKIF